MPDSQPIIIAFTRILNTLLAPLPCHAPLVHFHLDVAVVNKLRVHSIEMPDRTGSSKRHLNPAVYHGRVLLRAGCVARGSAAGRPAALADSL